MSTFTSRPFKIHYYNTTNNSRWPFAKSFGYTLNVVLTALMEYMTALLKYLDLYNSFPVYLATPVPTFEKSLQADAFQAL